MALIFVGCIEDGVTLSPSDQPAFSVDTLDIGTVYTDELTVTSRFVVYNRHSKGLNISSVSLSGADANIFRINVDGMSGHDFSNIEIRANDSIFVFVEAQLPENGAAEPQQVTASLDFLVNGVVSSVTLTASGQDINRLNGLVISEDTVFDAMRPYRIADSLVVAEGATLTLTPGVRMLFRDKSSLVVRGTLVSQGTPEAPVTMTGDRTGNVLPGVSFDIMSRQWDGIDFMETSTGNVLQHTVISNTCYGVAAYGNGPDLENPQLTLVNSVLRNSGECVLAAINTSVDARGCEFAEASHSTLYILGGKHRFDQCTVANYYLFSAVSGAMWYFVDPVQTEEYAEVEFAEADITNTITYGLGALLEPGDIEGRGIYFRRCLFGVEGTDDANFVECLWGADPLFYTVRGDYYFDYRLKPESPAIGAAYGSLSERPLDVDFYGQKRKGDLGAYVYVEPQETN